MAKELLFEIGTEEIPSVYIPDILKDLGALARRIFEEERIGFSKIKTYATPRRLVLYVEGLEEAQRPQVREVIGPPKAVAFDEKGEPTKAALGFAKAQGIPIEKLKIKRTERGEYVVATIEEKGSKTIGLLPSILPRIVTSLPFPKSMRWGDLSLRFVRPIRWLCAVYGGRTVAFELDGIKSSNKTYGHRFLSPRSIRIRSFQEYLEKLEKKHVIVDQNKRRELVKKLAQEAAKKVGGRPVLDKDLVEMLTNLVEYPNMVCGGFAREYLELPKEVVITPMRKHQRYLPVVDDQGNLLPSFVAVSNMRAKDMEPIREGNEQVLKARLEDADFYYRRDLKLPLAERVPTLRRIIFQERLGSLYDKTERLQELAAFLAERIDPSLVDLARRAAYLSKADLVTAMVKEFTELQGTMGRIYALHFGEREEVAQAIEEHYLPRFAGDQLPASTLGAVVGVADRMDSLAGCFGIGLIPTGSEDPYALRRAALGILQILLERPLPLRLPDMVGKALNLCWGRLTRPIEEVERELLEFLRVRLEGFLVERGIPSDLVEAALSAGFDNVFDAGRRAEALAQFRREPDFAELSGAFKRVVNIIPEGFEKPVDPTRFLEGAERALHGEAMNLKGEVDRFLSAGDYLGALRRIATVKPIVDMFFEEVLVNVEDEAIRLNRYALLKEVADLFTKIADFRKIVVA